MQAPQLRFAVPGLGRPRPIWPWSRSHAAPDARPSGAEPGEGRKRRPTRPHLRLPILGPRVLVALLAGLMVLLPGLLAAELIVQTYEARLTADTQARATAGLDG